MYILRRYQTFISKYRIEHIYPFINKFLYWKAIRHYHFNNRHRNIRLILHCCNNFILIVNRCLLHLPVYRNSLKTKIYRFTILFSRINQNVVCINIVLICTNHQFIIPFRQAFHDIKSVLVSSSLHDKRIRCRIHDSHFSTSQMWCFRSIISILITYIYH